MAPTEIKNRRYKN